MNVIDKLNNSYRENRIYYFMVLIFFCVGIALGAFMVMIQQICLIIFHLLQKAYW